MDSHLVFEYEFSHMCSSLFFFFDPVSPVHCHFKNYIIKRRPLWETRVTPTKISEICQRINAWHRLKDLIKNIYVKYFCLFAVFVADELCMHIYSKWDQLHNCYTVWESLWQNWQVMLMVNICHVVYIFPHVAYICPNVCLHLTLYLHLPLCLHFL